MKKLLGIIVLGLLWSNVGFAEYYEFNKCATIEFTRNGKTSKYANDFDGHKSSYKIVGKSSEFLRGRAKKLYDLKWEYLSKFYTKGQKIKTKDDVLYTINSDNGLIIETTVYTDEYVEYLNKESHASFKARRYMGEKNNLGELVWEKVMTRKYKIVSFTGSFLLGEYTYGRGEFSDKIKLNINLENLTVRTVSRLAKSTRIEQCKQKGKNENDDSGTSGTAFFINKKGYLLTNNHVVDGCTLSKISYKNKEYNTKLIATDKTLDLALLKAELKPKTFINFSNNEAKKLNTIYVAGYPLGKGLSDDLKISSGIVSSLKGFEDNSNEIQIDAPINSGNSGGPIINENGDLIAIAVSGMAKDQTEGINFGIKSSAAERFLKSNNINVNKSLYSRSKNKEQLLNILEEGTVYTYCD
jgi:V8-like Glu-specific endopeptidase